jgi:hypothetical protein
MSEANVSEIVYPSSEAALDPKSQPKVYPFESLKPGFSFFIGFDNVNEKSLRAVVCAKSKKLNRSFRCIAHKQHRVFEICELPPIGETKFEMFESSPEAKAFTVLAKPTYISLKHGTSYAIPFDKATDEVLKFNTKQFAMIRHEQLKIVEVFRIRKETAPVVQSSPQASEVRNDT